MTEKKEYKIKLVGCCTCDYMGYVWEMVEGIQCLRCFYKKIPMFKAAPVREEYFDIMEKKK